MKTLLFILLFISVNSQASQLEELKKYWLNEVVEYCEGYPSKENCDDGDSTIFNGLLCLSGEKVGCEAVKDAQGPDGRWWRSPRRMENSNFNSGTPFSRDQAMGVLAYLAATKDKAAALRWYQWIKDNRPCSIENPFTGNCTVKGLHRLCKGDDSMQCTITPTVWSLMGYVWSYIGLERSSLMSRFSGSERSDIELEAAKTAKPGYRLHLKAIQSHISQYVGVGINSRIMRTLFERQPENPYFQYVLFGPSQAIFDKVIDVCPNPEYGFDSTRFQWAWERATSSEAWHESMGWDCIFLSNLI